MPEDEPSNQVLLTKIEALSAQVERNRSDAKEDLANLADAFREQVANIVGSFRGEGGTWRTEHVRAEDQRWASHTGENGDHETLEATLAKQRSEDQARLVTWIQIGASIATAALILIGGYILMHLH